MAEPTGIPVTHARDRVGPRAGDPVSIGVPPGVPCHTRVHTCVKHVGSSAKLILLANSETDRLRALGKVRNQETVSRAGRRRPSSEWFRPTNGNSPAVSKLMNRSAARA